MRSLNSVHPIIDGCKLIPGKYYILEFPNRVWDKYFLFEFDSMDDEHGVVRICHRNKWGVSGCVCICQGVECLVSIDGSEKIKFRRYRKVVDWDKYALNDGVII